MNNGKYIKQIEKDLKTISKQQPKEKPGIYHPGWMPVGDGKWIKSEDFARMNPRMNPTPYHTPATMGPQLGRGRTPSVNTEINLRGIHWQNKLEQTKQQTINMINKRGGLEALPLPQIQKRISMEQRMRDRAYQDYLNGRSSYNPYAPRMRIY